MSADPLLPVEEAAQRLNVSVETVLRYARRNKWRKLKGNDGVVLVAVPPDMLGRPGNSLQEPPPPAPLASTPDATADAVRAAVAPLEAALLREQAATDRERLDRKVLQAQSDALRVELATVQIERAEAHGVATTERARREAAEARAADLQRQVDALEARQRRRWWHIFR